jgi:hypothetical protein
VFQNKSVILCETGYLEILWTNDYCPGEDTLRNSFKTNQITYLHVLQLNQRRIIIYLRMNPLGCLDISVLYIVFSEFGLFFVFIY